MIGKLSNLLIIYSGQLAYQRSEANLKDSIHLFTLHFTEMASTPLPLSILSIIVLLLSLGSGKLMFLPCHSPTYATLFTLKLCISKF